MADNHKSILPRGYNTVNTVPMDQEMRIEADGNGYCWNCDHRLGTVKNGNLYAGTLILTNRTNVRCATCRERNVYKPVR